jgi:hypothetical protein
MSSKSTNNDDENNDIDMDNDDSDDSDDGTVSSQFVVIVGLKVDDDFLLPNKSNSLVMIIMTITIII